MIEKNEILKMATGLNLNPDTAEKDYVLSGCCIKSTNTVKYQTGRLKEEQV